MPEIPDLNIFCTNLAERLMGKTLKTISILEPRRLKAPEPAFKDAIEGHKLTAVNRLGKQLYFEFANKHVLSIQLVLYGSMHWYEAKNENKFTIAELLFKDGTGLAITDWQKAVILSLHPEVSDVPDALHLPKDYLDKALKDKNKAIKTVLQEGKVVQGIGNAYVDEILYAAKLSPFSIAAKIPEKKIAVLTEAIKEVLTEAEAHIRKNFPDTITEKERDFLQVHRPRHKHRSCLNRFIRPPCVGQRSAHSYRICARNSRPAAPVAHNKPGKAMRFKEANYDGWHCS